MSDDACYRAMDWLLDIAPELEKEVFWQVATLLDHEVDLLFFDTTSTYFEIEDPDTPAARDTHGRLIEHPPTASDTTTTSSSGTGSDAAAGSGTESGTGAGGGGWGSGRSASRRTPVMTCRRW